MVQTNIVVTEIEEFFVIEKAFPLDIFLKIIYTTVLKLLAAILTMV